MKQSYIESLSKLPSNILQNMSLGQKCEDPISSMLNELDNENKKIVCTDKKGIKRTKKRNIYMYAHNSKSFDAFFILHNKYLKKLNESISQTQSNQGIKFKSIVKIQLWQR